MESFEGWVEDTFFGYSTIREARGVSGPIGSARARQDEGDVLVELEVAAELDAVARSLEHAAIAWSGYRFSTVDPRFILQTRRTSGRWRPPIRC